MIKILILKSVLIGTLVVMCISGCGKSTAEYLETEEIVESENETEVLETTEEIVISDETEAPCCVYICGAVEIPGVYTLPEGSRVCDAFAAAGGLKQNAAEDYWNQARVLADGEMIYVPTLEEAKERKESGDVSSMIDSVDDSTNGKVNINTASKQQLMTIPGVGEAKAQAIISYREVNGSFSSIDEVKKVEGIKDGVFAKMKEYIVIN